MTQTLPVTDARKKLLTLVDEVNSEYKRVDLTKNGRVRATLVSPEYLDSLEETIYSLHNSMDDIHQAEKEIAKGEYMTLETVKEDLKKRMNKNAR